ncbi:HTH_Tnp_Tc3_2 domain-containing protein [Trichonephila clavipes]|nr:HTH_Tnp_Tc3_2 domain-containing protein [Trichonephila clavipes]
MPPWKDTKLQQELKQSKRQGDTKKCFSAMEWFIAQLRVQLMETVSGKRIHPEKAWEITTSQLSRELYAATGIRVSVVTVSKRLHEKKLFVRRPVVYFLLRSANRRVSLKWYRDHTYTMDHWVTVLFTKESRFPVIVTMLSYGENHGPTICRPISEKMTITAAGGWMI